MDAIADLEQPGDLEFDDELAEHVCPLHADVELLDDAPTHLTAYEERWLELACSDVSFHEDAARHAREIAEIPDLDYRRRAYFRGQAAAALKSVKGIRARMRRLLLGEPEPDGPSLVDLWDRS